MTSFPTTALSTNALMAPPVGTAIFGTRVLVSQDSKVRIAMISVTNVSFYICSKYDIVVQCLLDHKIRHL